jgi:PAS domain S-box-containing protein
MANVHMSTVSDQSAGARALGSLLAEASRQGTGGRAVLDALPAAVYITDADGKITYYNEAAAELWGFRPELGKSAWCGSWKLFWPDGTPLPHDECPMALTIKEKRAVRGMEAIAERPDGTRVPFVPYPTPLFDANGELIGAVNMLVDITDRKRNEQSAQHFAAIVESSDDAIVSKDLNGTIISWNKGAERLFGYTAEEMVGRPIILLIPEERLDEEPSIISRIRRGERIDHYETIRRRKDGSLIEISLTVSPVKDSNGRITGASKIARDISERRRAQEHQQLLLAEMKHRIKNNLATVQAIASQTMKTASPEEKSAFNARLQALGRAHDLLTMENWNRASLHDVVREALHAFQEAHRTRLMVEGPSDIWLNANKSALLAMGLHELATNAVKYGALSNGSGQVRVHWKHVRKNGTPAVRFQWQESGGPTVKPPEKKGFGSLLVERALNGELGDAKIDFAPDGVVCNLEIGL